MSRGFKLIYDQMQENNPSGPQNLESVQPSVIALEDHYGDIGHLRNICFVFIGGKRTFLSYNCLVSCGYDPLSNMMSIVFTANTVVVQGVNLENLFYGIMNQVTKQVMCMDKRYNVIEANEAFTVNDIVILNN